MSIAPFKTCEFLKSHEEVTRSNEFLAQRNLLGNPCDCKNWDLAHILPQLSHGNILDMGCQGSYILANALRMGLQGDKVGIDLASLPPVPGANLIRGDLTNTGLPSNHFDFITCLSVIEHGVNVQAFCNECARILKPGGTLFLTFDYWPTPINHNIRLFDLDWTIFTRDNVQQVLDLCRSVGLEPVDDIDWTTRDGVIRPGYHSPGAFSYTFGILQLRKAPSPVTLTPPAQRSKNVLLVNSTREACGVHQFGQRIYDVLAARQKQFNFHLARCASAQDVQDAVAKTSPCAIIFNYHPSTQPFVNRDLIRQLAVPCLGIYHEITPDVAGLPASPEPFDRWIHSDPSMSVQSPFMFPTVRPIFQYENRFPQPQIPTIGTFGFGFTNKGIARLARLVQSQFQEAVFRLHVPFAFYGDADGQQAHARIAEVRSIIQNPRIRIEATHHMMSDPELLDFLAQNSVNAFLYDDMDRGISSVLDYAISVDRPVAISRSRMFRHVWSARPSILVDDAAISPLRLLCGRLFGRRGAPPHLRMEKTTLPEIIRHGTAPLRPFKTEWSNENMAAQYEQIVWQTIMQRAAKA